MQTDDQPATGAPVRTSVVVRRPVAETFALFTDGLDSWWPLHTHSIAADRYMLQFVRRRKAARP